MTQRLFALVLLAATVAACSAEPGNPPTAAELPSTSTSLAELDVPPTLAELSSTTISIEGRDLTVAVADTSEKRANGLAGVTELGDLDGMLFTWDADTESGFWMRDTLIPVDVAFFTDEGRYVGRISMVPCTPDSCPTHHTSGPYRYAVEVPTGDLDFVGQDSVLVIDS